MILIVVIFAAGVFLLVKGGDMFIDAAGWVSDVSGVSRVVIGATLVSFATTAPE
jgi:cation:H+ antiporter